MCFWYENSLAYADKPATTNYLEKNILFVEISALSLDKHYRDLENKISTLEYFYSTKINQHFLIIKND